MFLFTGADRYGQQAGRRATIPNEQLSKISDSRRCLEKAFCHVRGTYRDYFSPASPQMVLITCAGQSIADRNE